MAHAFSVFVNIGGTVSPTLAAAVGAAKTQVRTLGTSLAGIGASINAPFIAAQKQIAATTKSLSKMQAKGRDMSLAVSLPTAMVGKNGYDIVYGYEKELNKIQAYGELSDAERKRIEDNAREMARIGLAGAKDAVELQRRYVQAGRTVDQAIGMARPTLNFSLFGDVEPAKAADVITSIAAAYQKPMDTLEQAAGVATRIGDVLAKGANISRADVSDFAEGFKYVAPLAAKAGMSIEQVTAAIATMNQHGLQGNEAGVALRSMLVRMVKPTADARAAIEGYGLSFEQFVNKWEKFDSTALKGVLALNGINVKKPLMDKVSAAVKDMDPQTDAKKIRETVTKMLVDGMDLKARDGKVVAKTISNFLGNMAQEVDADALIRALEDKNVSLGSIAKLFDVRQGARLATLFNGDLYQKMLDQVNDKSTNGASARGAETMLKGLIGASLRLKGAWDNLWISIARSGVLDSVTSMLTKIATTLDNMGRSNPALLRGLTEFMVAAAVAGPALFLVATGAKVAAVALGAVLVVTKLLLAPFRMLVVAMLAIPAAARGLVAAAAAIKAFVAATAALRFSTIALIGLGAALPAVARGLGMLLVFTGVGAAIAAITAALVGLGLWIKNNWDGIKNFFGGFGEGLMAGLKTGTPAVKALADSLGSVMGWFTQLTGALNLTNEQWREWGGSVGFAVANGVNKIAEAVQSVIGLFSAAIEKATAFGNALKSAFSAAPGGGAAAGLPSGSPGARVFGKRGAPAVPLAGARALGGPVSFGKPYLVGERGPELFVPSATGRIETNDTLRKLTADGAAAIAGSTTTNTRGPVTITNHWEINGAENPRAVAEQVDRRFSDLMRRLESDQRGLLSD